MYFEEGVELLLEGTHYFHKNYKKIYGQLALRLDNDTYLTTGGNKLLCELEESDITACDIKTGDLGKLFMERPNINVFIFGCTQDSAAASEDLDYLPVALDDMAHLAGSKVKIVADASPDTLLSALSDTDVCLIQGSGFVVVSDTMWQAAASAQVIEKTCEAHVQGKVIGGTTPIDTEVAEKLREEFLSSYLQANENSITEYIEFDEEAHVLRNALKKTCDSLVQEELVFGSWGNVSARLDDETFMITPTAINTLDMKIEDLTRVRIDDLECLDQMKPSGSSYLHAEMYKNIPECNAIIHTHSNACSIFAACSAGFAINDSNLTQLIGDIKLIPFAPESKKTMADKTVSVMKDTHAAIMANQGAIFYGPSLEVVLEVAKSVEILARKLLNLE